MFTMDTGRGKSLAFSGYTTIYPDSLKEETFYAFSVLLFSNI